MSLKIPALPLPHAQAMPVVGFGTFRLTGAECERAVATALEVGYRHIDTAMFYGNHREVGRAIAASGIARDELFVTTKVWRDRLTLSGVQDDCKKMLDELGLRHLDLYLMHWPNDAIPIADTLAGMAAAFDAGLCRNIGVANFTVKRLAAALKVAPRPIAVNQVEYHPYLNQEDLRAFCGEHRIALTAYCPIARGEVAGDDLLRTIGHQHGKTPAQVALRWLIDKGLAVIPKASSRQHIGENFAVLDWRLDPGEVAAIDARKIRKRLVDWDVAGFDDC